MYALALPHGEAAQVAATLNANDLLVVRPGARVKIEMNVMTPSEDRRKQIEAGLRKAAEQAGLIVADDAPLRLVASTSALPGREQTYGMGLFGARDQVTISIPMYENRLALVYEGKTVWDISARSYGSAPGSIPQGRSPQEYINEINRYPAESFFNGPKLPRYVANPAQKNGLGHSRLTLRGPIPWEPTPPPPGQ